jgi:glycosylphosphatidylinositol transamidase
VISDDYQEGMHAWLSAYHHSAPQYSEAVLFFLLYPRYPDRVVGMTADELELSPGVIWTALNIDYPGHSFSHLGAYHGTSARRCLSAGSRLTLLKRA